MRSFPDLRTLCCQAQVPRRWTGLPRAGEGRRPPALKGLSGKFITFLQQITAWCHEMVRHEAEAIPT